MASYKVEYMSKYASSDGKKCQAVVTAPTIRKALEKVETRIITPMLLHTQERVIITKIELINDEKQ